MIFKHTVGVHGSDQHKQFIERLRQLLSVGGRLHSHVVYDVTKTLRCAGKNQVSEIAMSTENV